MDKIFKALSDRHRLQLLDALKETDGQTLSELEKVLPDLSRFGVMKHLKTLEEVMLITTRKVGRFKYHYLNIIPIQEISDRWISRFSGLFATGMVDLKNQLEGVSTMATRPKHVFTTIIQTSPKELWDALTNSVQTEQYFFGLKIQTDWSEGSDIFFKKEDGSNEITGKVIKVVPYKLLSHTFNGKCKEGQEADAPSKVTYEIKELGASCKLTLIHDDFDGETETYKGTGEGWPVVLSGLKTLLETGKVLEMG